MKIHWKPTCGVKFLLEEGAISVGGTNHSHATQDLYDSTLETQEHYTYGAEVVCSLKLDWSLELESWSHSTMSATSTTAAWMSCRHGVTLGGCQCVARL